MYMWHSLGLTSSLQSDKGRILFARLDSIDARCEVWEVDAASCDNGFEDRTATKVVNCYVGFTIQTINVECITHKAESNACRLVLGERWNAGAKTQEWLQA